MALAQRACSGTALVLCAVLVGPVHAAKVSDAAATHEWMSTPVRTAAEQMLAAMPDDYYSIKGVAAEKADRHRRTPRARCTRTKRVCG